MKQLEYKPRPATKKADNNIPHQSLIPPARAALAAAARAFEDPAVAADFNEWLKLRRAKEAAARG